MLIKIKCFFLKIWLFIALILIDQVTKILAINHFRDCIYCTDKILPFLDFTLVFNSGISFGMLNGIKYGNIILLFFTSVIITLFIYMFIKCKNYLEKYGLILIISGAIGNIIDRIIHNAVVDFIYVNYGKFSFPVFNVADSLISIGGLLIVVFEIKKSIQSKKNI